MAYQTKLEMAVARAITGVSRSADHLGCRRAWLCEAKAAIMAVVKHQKMEARADTRRLDWITKNGKRGGRWVFRKNLADKTTPVLMQTDKPELWQGEPECTVAKSPRAAIDGAMGKKR